MVSNTTHSTNKVLWVNNENFNIEYRSSSGVGIIKWRLPTTREINKLLDEKISAKELDKLYQVLSKTFLAREFIDLDIFEIPETATWLHTGNYVEDVYDLPKGRSKVRIDETDDGNILVCQWHLPSHLTEYFNSSENPKHFEEYWHRNCLIEVVLDIVKKI